MSVSQKKDGRWYSKYWEDSKYHKKYFGRGKSAKTKAQDFDLKVKRLKKRSIKVREMKPKFKRLHVDELSLMYLNDKRNIGWSEKQQYDFMRFVNRYVIKCLGNKLCTDVTMADVITGALS